MQSIQFLFVSAVIAITTSSCDTSEALDIIFIVDSSGSVYDNEYKKWNAELDLIASIVQDSLPINTRGGLINFSGCGSSYTLEQCQAQNRLKKMISLNEFGIPNDLQSLYDRIEAIGPDDFNGGYTWTDQALQIALNEFEANPRLNVNKIIVLITDGEPFPDRADGTAQLDHHPCRTHTGYVSDTLKKLRESDVVIITVGIDMEVSNKESFFQCMTQNMDKYFFDGDFNTLPDLSQPIGQLICGELTKNEIPTLQPTVAPTTQS